MSDLLVITGPPGAGKSTVAKLIAERFDRSVLVAGDDFFGFLAKGAIAPWLREAHEQNEVVVRASAEATGVFVRSGYDAIFDGVVGPWFLPKFATWTQLSALQYVVLLPAVERCIERVANRESHEFRDEAVTRHMHDRFTEVIVEDRFVLRDALNSADDTVEAILGGIARGRFHYSSSV